MTRIITPEINKKVKKEYTLRFFSVLFFVLTVVMCVHILLALSSYVLLSSYEKIYQQELGATDSEVVKQNEEFFVRSTKLYELAKQVPDISRTSAFDIFEKIQDYKTNQIAITVFETYVENKETKITLRGMADSREALLAFNDRMRSESSFVDFNIPLETLTKQRDIAFDVTFTYYENQ